jgi:hypothetical protein
MRRAGPWCRLGTMFVLGRSSCSVQFLIRIVFHTNVRSEFGDGKAQVELAAVNMSIVSDGTASQTHSFIYPVESLPMFHR